MTSTKLSTQLAGIANLALLAPVKPGFVDGFESITYAKRLDSLLKVLNAIRQASREAAVVKSPFPDAVGRLALLQSFRYAIVPPEVGSAGEAPSTSKDPQPGLYRLSLNVTFDGGWEPYMRVIYRDLGPLLDAIFCNCTDYPVARSNSFDTYTQWVRKQEVPGGLYYTESAMTVPDQRYLDSLEKLYRNEQQAEIARLKAASLSLKQPPKIDDILAAFNALDPGTQLESLKSSLKALKALYDLRFFYPNNAAEDEASILRFSKSVMPEFLALVKKHRSLPKSPFQPALEVYKDPIDWVNKPATFAPPEKGDTTRQATGLQAGIVSRYDGITHGCLVLLRVTDADKAQAFLSGRTKKFSVSFDGEPEADIRCNVAFTLPGLQALGVPAWHIDKFPHEFIEGMETRAGLLGDVRGNHPSHWRRPTRRGSNQEVDLGTVHVVVQFRLKDPKTEGHDLHPDFAPEIAKLEIDSGLRVLSVDAMRSYPECLNGETITREHFGFRDGISQPVIEPASASQVTQASQWSDGVKRGEIFLGYDNDRGDGPYPFKPDPLLDNGTFLVLRKIRQRVDTLHSVMQNAGRAANPHFDHLAPVQQKAVVDGIQSSMVGRTPDGQPLVAGGGKSLNDFNYAGDPAGLQCPFQSHVRRTNPRTGPTMLPKDSSPGPNVPRIVRRGMSYGPRSANPADERGVYFMAYCASIAEQFEIIQRWVAGGNSTGILSTHSDPLLGVPQSGEHRSFQYLNQAGEVATVDLGDKPLTELQWGMYLFVPSMNALSKLASIAKETAPASNGSDGKTPGTSQPVGYHPPGPVGNPSHPTPINAASPWKRLLEDHDERDKTYEHLKAANKVPDNQETPYGMVVASQAQALKVLQDNGKRHSVCGYGRRMERSISLGYLGLDPGPDYAAQATGVNAAIAEIKEEDAFSKAAAATEQVIKDIRQATQQALPGSTDIPLNIVTVSEHVLGLLCALWFGLPDQAGTFMDLASSTPSPSSSKAACPQNFFSVARYLFWPHPSKTEEADGMAQGQLALAAVKKFLATFGSQQGGTAPVLGELSQKIANRLAPIGKNDPEVVAKTIAGVMLGFPPTVHQNFLRVMMGWIDNHTSAPAAGPRVSLWDLQADLGAAGPVADYATTAKALRAPLLAQMRRNTAPEMIWREAPNHYKGDVAGEPDKTVVWLAGVMMDPKADDRMMFGGQYKTSPGPLKGLETIHGCPGYEMAIGVLLGMVSAILRAGTLQPTPSSTVVNLKL